MRGKGCISPQSPLLFSSSVSLFVLNSSNSLNGSSSLNSTFPLVFGLVVVYITLLYLNLFTKMDSAFYLYMVIVMDLQT